MVTRRDVIFTGAALGGAFVATAAARSANAAQSDTTGRAWERSYSGGSQNQPALAPGQAGKDYRPVVTPNGAALPFKIVDGVKVFHLIAEEVEHEFAPGLKGRCWGYNGRVHGPTIEAVEGDHVRIYVTNKLK